MQVSPTKSCWIVPVSRTLIAIVLVVWAVEFVIHPELLPGVPLRQLTPRFVPGFVVWGYLTSVIYAVCGIGLLINKGANLAAAWVGLFVLFSAVVFCVPIMVQHGSDIGSGLNVFADTLLLSGAALCLSGSQREA